MPKIEIDYSNTIIYKITCKDPLIKDIYVGHTTNFVQRKHSHKQSCNNLKSKNYKLKLYQVIRANGGWKNWIMEIIDFFNLNDHYEARQKEQEYYVSLKATLNSNEPCQIKKPKVIKEKVEKKILYSCNDCNKKFLNNELLEIHTKKHTTILKNLMVTEKFTMKNRIIYNCEKCEFTCYKKSEWERHIQTNKHIKIINSAINNKINNKNADIESLTCKNCNRFYKCRTGLWRHNKKYENNTCVKNDVIKKSENEMKTLTNIVLELVKNNSELQKQHKEFQLQMMEICKNSNVTNISNNNSHNKTFNLQVFLNEECKDAMNLSEFIESIHLKIPDLLNIGKLGYTEGISKIILKELNETAQNKRPVHCSDAKRETMYVKQENKWEKEGPENIRLKNAIKNIEQKNIALLMNEWKAEHPDHMKSESSENDEYLRLVNQITSGSEDNLNKVVRRIANDVIINKK
jgi:hypothetical protein